MNISSLLEAAKKGTVAVTFIKVDTGEERRMICTLNTPHTITINQNPKNDYILLWALDRNAWRDVKVSTITDWSVVDQ